MPPGSRLLAMDSPVARPFTSLSAVLKETSCCLALLQSTRHACRYTETPVWVSTSSCAASAKHSRCTSLWQ